MKKRNSAKQNSAQRNSVRFFQTTQIIFALAAFSVFSPALSDAAVPPPSKILGVCGTYFENGTSNFVNCSGEEDLQCLLVKKDAGKTLPTIKPKKFLANEYGLCLPEITHGPCGNKTTCANNPQGNTDCATVQSLTSKKIDVACLNKQEVPQSDDAKSNCTDNKKCDANSQCVRIIAYEYTGINEFVAVQRCIPVQKLPPSVLDKDKGSCGQNATCSATEACIENTFEPTALKSYVCYDQKFVSKTSCTNIGASCALGDGKNGHCMNVLIGGKKTPLCVDALAMPYGPSSASMQTCAKNSDCKGEQGYVYCLVNPATKKNQCFSQKTIFTDMKNPDAMQCGGKPCCTNEELIAKKKLTGCDPSGAESICTQLAEKQSTLICVNYIGGGTALGTGAGAADEKTYMPEYKAESNERFAPVLEIDIPTINFTEKLTGQKGDDGTSYMIPFLAIYINGIYKYGLGVGALFATVMIIYAGFTFMTSFGNAKAISDAKEMATNATLGLLLLMSVFTILYVINPELTKMKAIKILAPHQDVFFVEQTGFDEVWDGETFDGPQVSITPGQLPRYKQGAKPWAEIKYLGNSGEELKCSNGSVDTLKSSGCGIMSLTAVLNFHGVKVSPYDVALTASKNGAHASCTSGTNSNIMCKTMEKNYPGLTCKWLSGKANTDPELIAKTLRTGKPVIFSCHKCIGKTSLGTERSYKAHYMVLTGVDASGTQFAVSDSGSRNPAKEMVSISAKEFADGRIVNVFTIEKK